MSGNGEAKKWQFIYLIDDEVALMDFLRNDGQAESLVHWQMAGPFIWASCRVTDEVRTLTKLKFKIHDPTKISDESDWQFN